jgi:hypothetical protein
MAPKVVEGKTIIRLKPAKARRLRPEGAATPPPEEKPRPGYLIGKPIVEEKPIKVERELVFNEWRKPFLKSLRSSGNITAAARNVHVSRKTVEGYMEKSPSFAAEVKEAIVEAGDLLEGIALDRARKGSDFLLWRLLQGAKPEKYGNKSTVTHKFSEEDRKRVYEEAKREGLSDADAEDAVNEVERMIRAQASKSGGK